MASQHLLFLVILSLINSSFQDVTDNKADSENESPFADVAKQILKEKNLENIGGMVNNFLQSGGAKQVIDGVLENLGSPGSSQLFEGLSSYLNTDGDEKAKGRKKGNKGTDGVNPMDLLSRLGSIVGAMRGAGGEGDPASLLQGLGSLLGGGNNQGGGINTASLLQGLGSLISSNSQDKGKNEQNIGADILQGLGSIIGAAVGNQGGDNTAGTLLQSLGSLGSLLGDGQGGINQEMIGNIINTMTSSVGDEKAKAKPSKESPKKTRSVKAETKKAKSTKTNGLEGVLSLAKSFLNKDKEKGGDSEPLDFNLLLENFPLILKLAKSFGGPKLKPYLEPLDDIVSLFKDVTDKKKQFNATDFVQKISKIYKAYQELLAPYVKNLKSVDKSKQQDDSFDLGGILDAANSFLNQGGSGKGAASSGSGLMDYLPMIINTVHSFTGPEAQERALGHNDHSWSLPPVLEKIHVYFDTFLNSDMGKKFVTFIGGQPTLKMFRDETGSFNYNKFEELIENHSFRRHWIQQVVAQLVELLQVVADKKTLKQYGDMTIMFTNSFLQKSGFPKDALINSKKPAKSITNFANYAIKNYLDTDFDTRDYIEPVVLYIQDILKIAHKSISPGNRPKELTEKLTNTINMEIIEPVTRVNRAYRFAKLQPQCDKYVFCIVNQEVTNYAENLPTLKKGLYKSSSLIAGWFISSHTGTPYWDLYTIVTDNTNCNNFYKEICSGFHEEEIKATTEYVHNEL